MNHREKLAVSVGALLEFNAREPGDVKNFPRRLGHEWYRRYFPVLSGDKPVNELMNELGEDLDKALDRIDAEVKKGLDAPHVPPKPEGDNPVG